LGALVHKYIYRAAIAAVFFNAFGMSPAGARNDTLEMTIADALATPDAQQKLDGSVKFFFGDTAHPAVVHSFGYLATNQKTNSVNKSAKRACEWAFLSALLRFQKRAEQLGANAVVDIHSYYDKHDVSSNVSFECHDGFLLTGVALRGNFVRIAGQ
jgi:uncharacterized protein YbjQ (UPF0145 family)